MKKLIALTLLSVFNFSDAINRPVYKILLAQKGFAQFLQYDVEIPPLREFTFCTWIRFYHFTNDQTIYTYVVKGDKRVIRLWLEQGGTRVRLSVSGRIATSAEVNIAKDVWTHLCLSYQSDYGAWALYIDGYLVTCEVSLSLYGYVLPSHGSAIIGYGIDENGQSSGIEGEIFGANMILMSTIEKNISSQIEPQYEMTLFPKNKVKINEKIKYTVLSDLNSDDSKKKSSDMEFRPLKLMPTMLKHSTTTSDQDIGFDSLTKVRSLDNEMLDFSEETFNFTKKNQIPFWSIVNKTGQEGHFKKEKKFKELSSSGTQDLPAISLVETPPPIDQSNESFHGLQFDKPPTETSVYNMFAIIEDNPAPPEESKVLKDTETPPPIQANPNVYGQWSSSNFAGTVLNYLKDIKFYNKPQMKKIPPTIPLGKISDSLPYATEHKILNNPRKLSVTDKTYMPLMFQRTSFADKTMVKRAKRDKQINVEILEDDLRESILKMHALTKPMNVEVINRGENDVSTQRYYRNVDNQRTKARDDIFTSKDDKQPRPFNVTSDLKNHRLHSEGTFNKVGLMTILPFIKSVEYFTGSAETIDFHNPDEKQDMYTKTLWKGNKWHNTKSYSRDYTPRQIDMETDSIKSSMVENAADAHQHQTIRVKYVAKEHKTVPTSEDDRYIEQSRRLAQSVSGKSDISKGISLLQYNHGFLPGHMHMQKSTEEPKPPHVSKRKLKKPVQSENTFDKPIKIGNALNEGHVLGFNEEYTRKSFVGGDEKVPDINKNRSDFDSSNKNNVPPSLNAQVCKSMEDFYHLVLYIKPDGSIDNSHIMSPIKATNQAIEFILVNYQKCSIEGTKFEENPLLLINWSKTPVRLFGGAYPQKTKDLCGFF